MGSISALLACLWQCDNWQCDNTVTLKKSDKVVIIELYTRLPIEQAHQELSFSASCWVDIAKYWTSPFPFLQRGNISKCFYICLYLTPFRPASFGSLREVIKKKREKGGGGWGGGGGSPPSSLTASICENFRTFYPLNMIHWHPKQILLHCEEAEKCIFNVFSMPF